MRQRWFFVDRLEGDEAHITGDQAWHAARVLRLSVGDAVCLFDADDRRAGGTIAHIDNDRIAVRILSRLAELQSESPPTPAPVAGLTLATAIPKGDRADWLIEKCAELGVAAVWPINYERGVVVPGPAKLERWRRKAIEAAKQAMPPRLLKIESPCTLPEVQGRVAPSACLWYGETAPTKRSFVDAVVSALNATPPPSQALLFIGPEGGLTAAEHDSLHALRAEPVSLGASVLRIETACVAAAAIWSACIAAQDGDGSQPAV